MKLGLGQSYDKVQILNTKTRAYADLTKPASSVGVGVGYLLASFFYFLYTGTTAQILANIGNIIAVSMAIFLAHSASQSLNMAEDAEMDMETEHKQNRPIPSGVVSEEEARTVTWLTSGWALSLAFMVRWQFGLMVMALLFFGVFYNLSPIRAKERIISIPWQAVSRGLLFFPAVWAAYGSVWEPEAWVLGLFMFFYVLGFQNSADIIDRHVDEKHGIRTFIVEYGVDGTMKIATAATGAMMVTIGLGVLTGVLETRFLYMLLITPFCAVMLYYMWEYPHEVSDLTGNNPAWLHFYLGMVLSVVIPLTVEYFYTVQ